jgi:ribonuclease BN (tRNA processing enzyme)
MKLTVVGCSGSFPGPESPASCYLLEAPHEGGTFRLVLDLGNGALGALQTHVDLGAVDAVVLSHLHADHCLDLCGLYVACKYGPGGPRERIPVYGPEGTAERIAKGYDLDPNPGMTQEFDFRSFPSGPFDLGPFQLLVSRVEHPVEAFAVKVVHGDGTLVYSGDTATCESLVSLASGCDLLLAEASFMEGGDNPPGLHMTGREAAQVAERAGVGQLALTHIPPWNDPQAVLAEATPYFSGEVVLAEPGRTFKV